MDVSIGPSAEPAGKRTQIQTLVGPRRATRGLLYRKLKHYTQNYQLFIEQKTVIGLQNIFPPLAKLKWDDSYLAVNSIHRKAKYKQLTPFKKFKLNQYTNTGASF